LTDGGVPDRKKILFAAGRLISSPQQRIQGG
jgi:hypothetical protein